MNSGFDRLQDLETQIQAMSRTESPAELFKVLRDACKTSAPRGTVFLVRKGQLNGWAAFGYDATVSKAARSFSCSLAEGWLGALATATETFSVSRADHESGPEFGQPNAAEAVASVVRIQGKPVAIVIVERDANETPWYPEVNGMLVTMAQLRLELDLALRKMQSQQAKQPQAKTVAAPAAQPTPEPTAAPVEMAPEPIAPEETSASAETSEVTEVAPAPEGQDQDQPDLEAARRYARLVATDIRLYNEEAVVLGRRNGDLDRRLEEHLGRGKETFLRRHSDLGPTGLDLLHDAYVQVLAAGDDRLIPPSVLA